MACTALDLSRHRALHAIKAQDTVASLEGTLRSEQQAANAQEYWDHAELGPQRRRQRAAISQEYWNHPELGPQRREQQAAVAQEYWDDEELGPQRRQKQAAVMVDRLREGRTFSQTRPAQLTNGAVLPVDSKAEAAFVERYYGVLPGDPPGSEGWVCQLKFVLMAYPDKGSRRGELIGEAM